MTQISIRPVVTDEDVSVLRAINEEVQRKHFTPIIGEQQVDYMMDTLYTPERVRKNIEDGEKFFLMDVPDLENAGFFSYILKPDENKIKLSRVFVKEAARGLGLFTYAFDHIARVANDNGLHKIFLTVNRHNKSAIAAYEKKGFVKTDEAKFDIGGGYVMDDFIFEYPL